MNLHDEVNSESLQIHIRSLGKAHNDSVYKSAKVNMPILRVTKKRGK